MAKYTITYGRKVMVYEYEPIHIELTHEFDNDLTGHDEGLRFMSDLVNRWLEEEVAKLWAQVNR